MIKWEVVPIARACRLRIVCEELDRTCKHGVWLLTDGELIVDGTSSRSINVWAGADRPAVDIDLRTPGGLLHLYNIWDFGQRRESQSWTSGMLIEQLPNGRRYRCKDIGFKTKFDSSVFKIDFGP